MGKKSSNSIGAFSLKDFLEARRVPTPEEIAEQDAWIEAEIKRIGIEKLKKLIQVAVESRSNARCEFSDYAVGAAALWTSDKIYGGFNVEDPTYTLTDHAEMLAIKRGMSDEEIENGHSIEAIAVCHTGESQACGICRQYMVGIQKNVLVIAVDPEGEPFNVTSLQILLPYAFGKKQPEGN